MTSKTLDALVTDIYDLFDPNKYYCDSPPVLYRAGCVVTRLYKSASVLCRLSIMAIIPVLYSGDTGSIPVDGSINTQIYKGYL